MKSYHLNDTEITLKFTHPQLMFGTTDGCHVLIENTYALSVADQRFRIYPGIPPEADQAAAIERFCQDPLRRIDISDESQLTLMTALGSTISVGPNPDYDSWTLHDPDGLMIVCLPGGELGIWGPPEAGPSTDANAAG